MGLPVPGKCPGHGQKEACQCADTATSLYTAVIVCARQYRYDLLPHEAKSHVNPFRETTTKDVTT